MSVRTSASEALVISEIRYRRLFETAKDGILILDAKTGMVLDVNPFLIELLGFSHKGFLGKKVWELGFFKDVAANESKFAELQAQKYVRYEDLPLETKEGRMISVEFVSNVYSENGNKVIQCNIRDISARKRSEQERDCLEEEILRISESEQRRVGQDLHDGVCQTLSGIKFLTEALQRNLAEDRITSTAASADTKAIVELIRGTIQEARNLAKGLYPVGIGGNGLTAALEVLAAESAHRFQIKCKFKSAGPLALPNNNVATHIYRIIQEAINNAVRHGKAHTVVVTLAVRDRQVTLTIEDDGKGVPKKKSVIGMGLKTMDYRARAIGGTLQLRPGSRKGVKVICSFPHETSSPGKS